MLQVKFDGSQDGDPGRELLFKCKVSLLAEFFLAYLQVSILFIQAFSGLNGAYSHYRGYSKSADLHVHLVNKNILMETFRIVFD